jgi:opacity protein-like surface antigen
MPIAEPPGFYATVGAVLTPAVEQRYSTTTANGTTINTTSDVGAGLGSEAGIGYDFGKARAEITAIYNPRSINSTTLDYLGNKRTFQLDDVSIKTTSLMVSGYRDIPIIRNKLEAYLGGGVGVRYTTIDGFSLTPSPVSPIRVQVPSDHDTNFGYQAKVGLTYKVNKKMDIFTEAVYAGTITSSEGNLGILGVRIGTRRRF